MTQEIVKVHSINQEYWYMNRQKCDCGGRFEKLSQAIESSSTGDVDVIDVRCKDCSQARKYVFDISNCAGPLFDMNMMEKIEECAEVMSPDDVARAFGPPMASALRLISELAQTGDRLGLQYLSDLIAHAMNRVMADAGDQK